MLIKFFRNGQGGGAGPVDYLVEREVVAYDDNRNALRDSSGNILMFEREPLPKVLRGDPNRMRHLIDACPHQWSYRAGVLSFTSQDSPTEDQQRIVMDAFEDLAFAGLEPDQRSILWVQHTHEDRVELHFVTPRMELTSGRSLNIAPPGYQKSYDALRDVLNKEHGWSDPQAPERAREVSSIIEAVQRGQSRERIHDWVLARVEAGAITNRSELISQLIDVGFEVPRAGKNYVTVYDPERDERWRLKGDIFREDWTRKKAVERAIENSDREPSRSGSRLDALSLQELRSRLRDVTEKRAAYHRERYASSPENKHTPEPERPHVSNGDDFHRSADHLDELGSELVLGQHNDRQSATSQSLAVGSDNPSNGSRNRSQLGSSPPETDRLSYWQRTREVFANLGKGLIHGRAGKITDSTRKRIDAIRGTIDDSIRKLGAAIRGNEPELEESFERPPEVHRKVNNLLARISSSSFSRFDQTRAQFERIDAHPVGSEGKRNRNSTGTERDRRTEMSANAISSRNRNKADYSL